MDSLAWRVLVLPAVVTKGGIMSKSTYFVAPGQDRTKQVKAQIKQTKIEFRSISVVDEGSAVERPAHPESKEFRDAVNGSIVGLVIALIYGAATLWVIGPRYIPGVLGASLILGYSGLGGVMFGAIIGSTGIFATDKKN
jgi:hypothetical protein